MKVFWNYISPKPRWFPNKNLEQSLYISQDIINVNMFYYRPCRFNLFYTTAVPVCTDAYNFNYDNVCSAFTRNKQSEWKETILALIAPNTDKIKKYKGTSLVGKAFTS